MFNLNPESMTEELQISCGPNLKSVVLYGSAAAGDFTSKNSDFNLLVITQTLDVEQLEQLSKVSVRWVKQGNPPPLFFTMERFKNSMDVFPIEFSDIQDNHQILFGNDPFEGLNISQVNLRLELEHELKGKLIHIRERFLLTESKPKLVKTVMIETLSTMLVLFKNSLRLYRQKPPIKKMDALIELKKHINFDLEVFQILNEIKSGEREDDMDMVQLFKRYLSSVEKVVDGIDQYIHQPATATSKI